MDTFTGSYNDYQMTLVAYVPKDEAPIQIYLRESTLKNGQEEPDGLHMEYYSLDFSVSLKGTGKISKTISLTAKMSDESDDLAENLGWDIPGVTVTAPYMPSYSPPVMMPSWPSYGYGSGSGSSSSNGGYPFNPPGNGGGGGTTSNKVNKSFNNPCVSAIISKLQQKDMQRLTVPDIGGLQGTGHLSQGILDLFNKSGQYNITFKIAEAGYDGNGNPRNASTQLELGKNNWNVTIDDDYVRNATQLSIARTIIHESVHAFIGYRLKANPSSDMSSEIRNYYNSLGSSNVYSSGVKRNLTEHQFISQYTDALAISLSVWDNRRQEDGYYKKLAWAGLESSTAYARQSNKKEIQAAIHAELTASRDAKGIKCK